MEFSPDEAERVAALLRYGILDTEFELAYDRLTRLAANVLAAPMAAMSMIEGSRQWFKATVGVSARETPREWSFCHHVVLGKGTLVVPDATADPRFRDNPLVSGAPGIRFYAGAPLTTPDGYTLGALCVVDCAPRPPLSQRERAILEDLAGLAMDELELRRAAIEGQVNRASASLLRRLRDPLAAIKAAGELADVAAMIEQSDRALRLLDASLAGATPH